MKPTPDTCLTSKSHPSTHLPPIFSSFIYILQSTATNTTNTAPNFVYSRCFENPDGTHSVWNCFPGNPCNWQFAGNVQC